MKFMKYISLPSKETEHDPQSTSVNESGELTDPQWNNPDSPNSDNGFEHDNSEEEQETMLNKERGEDDTVIDMEENIDDMDYGKSKKPDKSILPCLCIAGIFIFAWVASAIIYGFYRAGHVTGSENSANRLQFNDLYNGAFFPGFQTLEWSKSTGDDDGSFIYQDHSNDNIILEHVADRKKKILVNGSDIIDPNGIHILYDDFSVSPDSKFVLLSTNRTKQWRYSHFSNYWIFNITSKTTFPLTKPIDKNHQAVITYAKWSPVGHTVAFIKDNDLYVSVDLIDERRITFDGSAVVFNGMPDWVYEEEVLKQDNAIWWSNEGKRLAYLRLNESEVPEYRFPLYLNGFDTPPYPREMVMRYPKPGSPNPVATFHVYNLDTPLSSQFGVIPFEGDFSDDERIITEVMWAGDDIVLVKVMNRVQDIARVVYVDVNIRKGRTVREENADKLDGGWYEINKNMFFVKKSGSLKQDGYVDVVVNNGYDHLALFSPIDSSTPKFLTSGEWEVDGGVISVDYKQELLYFISTEKSPIERHLYSVTFDGRNRTAITDINSDGYYSVNFSPGAQYYDLKYEGPDVPWQKVLKIGDSKFSMVLDENSLLRKTMGSLEIPVIKYLTIESGGNTLYAAEIRPPGMDESGREKYPVLFNVYGGPSSQRVQKKFDVNWHSFLASNRSYITVLVDTRGTGFRGRAFRCNVRKHLGEFESEDVINAGRYWSELPYVDSSRMAVWGWSYGGFLTSKVIEADSGVFQVGIAVAPVTDWRYYDSIYTERYMLTPAQNPGGYEYSAITNMTGFDHAKFLLVHGTGDDNVHFQNTASLVDRLTLASVHNYRVQFYTDNDHSIDTHNANRELYYLLTEYLWQSFGAGGTT